MIKRSHAPSETHSDYLVDKFQLREVRGRRHTLSNLESRSASQTTVAKTAIRQLYLRALKMQTDMF